MVKTQIAPAEMAKLTPREVRPLRKEVALGLLAFAAGCIDALSYLALGHVLPSAMTGNTVLLALSLGTGKTPATIRGLIALTGFVLGAAAGSFPLRGEPQDKWSRGMRAGFLFEAALLAAFFALFVRFGQDADQREIDLMILLAALAMGAQGTLARHFNVSGITTTVFTTTLVNIMRSLVGAGENPLPGTPIPFRAVRQIAAFFIYAAGALVGGILTVHAGWAAAVIPLAAVSALLVWQSTIGV